MVEADTASFSIADRLFPKHCCCCPPPSVKARRVSAYRGDDMRYPTHPFARLIFLALCCLWASSNLQAARLATLDWTLAETLIALDAPLVAVAQSDAYHEWVGEPALPQDVIDLGLRTQPNLELLADLAPSHILISPMFANLAPRLERIADVANFSLYQPDTDTWQEMQTLTRQVGELADRSPQAEQLIDDTRQAMTRLRDALEDEQQPLLMVQFMDARHVRVFGDNGLFDAVLDQLTLENAWQAPTNAWGFSLVGIEALAEYPNARLVVIEPFPVGVEQQLAQSGLWQRLPSVRENTLIRLPAIWSFGALPSAHRFATQLTAALKAGDNR